MLEELTRRFLIDPTNGDLAMQIISEQYRRGKQVTHLDSWHPDNRDAFEIRDFVELPRHHADPDTEKEYPENKRQAIVTYFDKLLDMGFLRTESDEINDTDDLSVDRVLGYMARYCGVEEKIYMKFVEKMTGTKRSLWLAFSAILFDCPKDWIENTIISSTDHERSWCAVTSIYQMARDKGKEKTKEYDADWCREMMDKITIKEEDKKIVDEFLKKL